MVGSFAWSWIWFGANLKLLSSTVALLGWAIAGVADARIAEKKRLMSIANLPERLSPRQRKQQNRRGESRRNGKAFWGGGRGGLPVPS